MASLLPLSGKLGTRLAKHLLKRATYNVTKSRIEEFSDYTVTQAMTKLLDFPDKNLTQPIHYVNGGLTAPAPWINDDDIYGPINTDNGSGQVKRNNYLAGWWLDEARRDTSVRAKMTYFLFTDFTTSIRTLDNAFHYDYLALLEFFCVGDWKEFCYQMSKNNVMLKFLNNDENVIGNPNENFAREILELFTIGKGPQVGIGDYTNYTETDVEQAAIALTGWTFDKREENRGDYDSGNAYGNIPCGYVDQTKHDFGRKEFSSRFNNHVIPAWDTTGKTDQEKIDRIHDELKEFIGMVLNQDETAKFITRKLYRYFVSRNITTEIENDIIAPLATTFRANYNLGEVITQLFQSQHFYDKDDSDNSDEIIGGMIKSPVDIALQAISALEFPVSDPIADGRTHYLTFYFNNIMTKFLVASGQDLFRPPSVAGFPPTYESPNYDRFWFNSSTIIPRYNIADILLNNNITTQPFYVAEFVRNNVSTPSDATILVTELANLFFPETLSTDRIDYFVTDVLLDGGSMTPQQWTTEWNEDNMIPNSGVEDALKPLLRAFLWAQEFQTN